MSSRRPPQRIWTIFEIVLSLSLLIAGYFLIFQGLLNGSASDTIMPLPGAVCLALGGMTLAAAIRSLIWHHRMMRWAVRQRLRDSSLAARVNASLPSAVERLEIYYPSSELPVMRANVDHLLDAAPEVTAGGRVQKPN